MRWIRLSGPLCSLLLMAAVGAVAEQDLMQRPPWAACEYCHGSNGGIDSPDVPAIAGQSASYIAKQLADFRAGRRISPKAQMRSAVLLLDAKDDAAVARHFATQAPVSGSPPVVADDGGAKWYWSGGAGQVPCVTCHPPTHDTLKGGYPYLFGLHRDNLLCQLRAFRDGSRTNDPGGVMREQAATLSDAQMEALAAYLASADRE